MRKERKSMVRVREEEALKECVWGRREKERRNHSEDEGTEGGREGRRAGRWS